MARPRRVRSVWLVQEGRPQYRRRDMVHLAQARVESVCAKITYHSFVKVPSMRSPINILVYSS